MASSCEMMDLSAASAGGRLHRLHAQPQRTGSGEGRQEEGRALRTATYRFGCHCTVTLDPWRGPYEHWRGRLDDLSARLIFFYMSDFVCNNSTEDLQWSTTRDLRAGNAVIFLFFFCSPPNTVTAYMKGYTLYCIYAMWSPAQPAGVCLTLVLVSNGTQRWRRRWIHRGFQSGPIRFALVLLET